jgi:hypothetical protein
MKLYHTIIDLPSVINLPFDSPVIKLYNRTVAASTQLFVGSIELLLTKDRKKYRHLRNFRNMAKNKLLGDKDYMSKWMEELVKE